MKFKDYLSRLKLEQRPRATAPSKKHMDYLTKYGGGELWHVFNVQDFKIEQCHNTEILGYNADEWQSQFFRRIAGAYGDIYIKYHHELWLALFKSYQLSRYEERLSYCVNIPLVCLNDNTVVHLREKSFCLEYDENKKTPIRILSVFSQINFYNDYLPAFNLAPTLLVNNRREDNLIDCRDALLRSVTGGFITELEGQDEKGKAVGFNATEIRCAEMVLEGKNAETIATELGKKKNDVNYYHRELLRKARLLFLNPNFKNAKEVAEFLAWNRLINGK